jgi:hypothetical protein
VEGFNFDIQSLEESIDEKNTTDYTSTDQLKILQGKKQVELSTGDLASAENNTQNTIIHQTNYQQASTEVSSEYKSIADLLQDEQMFRLDQDPVFKFDSEDLNNSFDFNNIKEFDGEFVLSEDYFGKPEDIEMFKDINYCGGGGENNNTIFDKKDLDERMSPLPAPPTLSLDNDNNTLASAEVQAPIKMEDEDFDLVAYINSNEVNNLVT